MTGKNRAMPACRRDNFLAKVWKIRSLRASHSGSTEQTIPEMIEHHKPE